MAPARAPYHFDRRSDKWATRTSADVSVPRFRYDVPPELPYHLITCARHGA